MKFYTKFAGKILHTQIKIYLRKKGKKHFMKIEINYCMDYHQDRIRIGNSLIQTRLLFIIMEILSSLKCPIILIIHIKIGQ
jgi:hypothetical protein